MNQQLKKELTKEAVKKLTNDISERIQTLIDGGKIHHETQRTLISQHLLIIDYAHLIIANPDIEANYEHFVIYLSTTLDTVKRLEKEVL